MIEENYETYKETYFHIFPASNFEAMAKELHAALVAYQKRLQEFEAFQQNGSGFLKTAASIPKY